MDTPVSPDRLLVNPPHCDRPGGVLDPVILFAPAVCEAIGLGSRCGEFWSLEAPLLIQEIGNVHCRPAQPRGCWLPTGNGFSFIAFLFRLPA